MMARLVLAGEAIVDLVMRVPRLPERGGDVLATGSTVTAGGGFNVMAAAARQGMPVTYAGGHGTGPWGELVRAALAEEGIAALREPDPRRDTGFDVALVDDDGERTFVTRLGAEALRDAGAWDATPLEPGDFVYISGYGLVPAQSGPVLANWAATLPADVTLFLDPGPLAADIPEPPLERVLARVDWLSCNAREAALLSGAEHPVPAARRLLDRTARASILVRDGAAGCLLAERIDPAAFPRQRADKHRRRPQSAPPSLRRQFPQPRLTPFPQPQLTPAAAEAAATVISRIPAPQVDAVDTTGAGDAHSGVFLAALAEGLRPWRAAHRANAAAALSVTRAGPATGPTRAELDAWMPAAWRSREPLAAKPPGAPGARPRDARVASVTQ
jgi:sugar/nucleoside kinase (ribokinase family)